jgi:hypothetical protein
MNTAHPCAVNLKHFENKKKLKYFFFFLTHRHFKTDNFFGTGFPARQSRIIGTE